MNNCREKRYFFCQLKKLCFIIHAPAIAIAIYLAGSPLLAMEIQGFARDTDPVAYQAAMQTVQKSFEAPMKSGAFFGRENFAIQYREYSTTASVEQGTFVLVTGRGTTFFQSAELIFDLIRNGYHVFVYDHRGQGISARYPELPPLIGHVDHFEDYAEDFQTFITEIVLKRKNKNLYVKATSMGGLVVAIGAGDQFLAGKAHSIVFVVPMISIRFGFPEWVVRLKLMFSPGKSFADGKNEWVRNVFDGNRLSSSRPRYEGYTQVYQNIIKARIAGPSVQWIEQSLAARDSLFERISIAHKLQKSYFGIPITVIQAGAERIVKNASQNEFCDKLNAGFDRCKLLVLKESTHGVEIESDKIRDEYLKILINRD